MWTFTIPGQEPLTATNMTSGELGLAYSMVAGAGVAHAEDEIAPAHCPLCRNAIAIVATMRTPVGSGTVPLEYASQLVCATAPDELKAMIDVPQPNRATRRAAAKPKRPVKKTPAKKSPAKKTG